MWSAQQPRHRTAGDDRGCPVVLLTRNGGLGFESQSGLIAALWPSGVIVRGPSAAGTLPGHYIGTLTDADLASLMDMVQSPKVWDHPRGEVVLDMPDDTLTLRRNTDVRQWEETPGFTTNPVVGEFRSRLFAVPVQDARRVSAPVDELLTCAAAK